LVEVLQLCDIFIKLVLVAFIGWQGLSCYSYY